MWAASSGACGGQRSGSNRDLGAILASGAGQSFLSGNWGWFGRMVVMWILNTVLGEELLFRGYCCPG